MISGSIRSNVTALFIGQGNFRKRLNNLQLSHKQWRDDDLSMNRNASPVLVVEDDHDLAELISCFLADANLKSVIASNGTDGLHQAQALLPSLVLCDSCMSGLGGVEVIERLRSDPATKHIPVVLMSGHQQESFDGSGADGFLQKPFQVTEMLALVRTLIGRPDESAREVALSVP